MCDFSRNPSLLVVHTKCGYYVKRQDERKTMAHLQSEVGTADDIAIVRVMREDTDAV